MSTAMKELIEHLYKEVDLKFLKQKDVNRVVWYINTYFVQKEHQQLSDAFEAGIKYQRSEDGARDIRVPDKETYLKTLYS